MNLLSIFFILIFLLSTYFISSFFQPQKHICYKLLLVAPIIIPFSYDELINVGDSLELFCRIAKGDKPLNIKWTFDSIDRNVGVQLNTRRLSDQTSMLSIASANAYHSGNYTCTAINRAGSTSYTTQITVNGTCKYTHNEPYQKY